MTVRFGALVFHADRRQLLRDGAEVHLTPKAFDLLSLLIERAPAVVPKPEIHARLWPDTFVADTTLVGVVKELRRALGAQHALIRTSHRVGYAFTAPAAAASSPAVACWLAAGERRMVLRQGTNVIGRDPAAAVWLDVAGVSRRHAQIIVENGAASIEDLGSKNGTLVADRPVRGCVPLRHGDRIQLATEQLVFHVSDTGLSTVTDSAVPAPHAPDE